ncbi:hypothetical protein [Merismopedia glauca]|uniref:hypothetical protein n=1 Tax=Merismopedia glauca TaxID=292586 RepID=UPI0015E6D99F|nr:hypothetical protein [Merismopedia glauca]
MKLSSKVMRYGKKVLQIATSATLLGTLVHAPAALAWKPTTHVYLGQQALKDALDDGKVSIYRVDYKNGKVLSKIGDYPVDPSILSALKSYPAQYRAGIFGPDAYPDILTGQQVIHPNPTDTGIAGGSGTWLKYLWNLSNTPGNNTPQIKAFVTGYLTHAAGDMYGHTFINNFTGGHFVIAPPDNAIKHILVEGYVDKRLNRQELDSNFFNASIAGVEDFIYRNMVDAKPGSYLDTTLLRRGGGGTQFSIPRIYSTLRATLQRDIDTYYATKANYDRRYNDKIRAAQNCGTFDFSCSAIKLYAEAGEIKLKEKAYITGNGLQITYKEHWRDDIDSGLRAWPQVSDQVAKAMFFNPNRKANVELAQTILQNYVNEHLISMSGAPDAVGQFAALGSQISTIIENTLGQLAAPIKELKANIYDAIIKSATGMTKQELVAYFENPERYFNQVFSAGSGERVNLQTFNQKYLHISDPGYTNPSESFDYQKFPAAYNTVTMSKLIMLSKDGVNQLLADLKSSARLNESNIMLGFIQTLDGDNEWSGQGEPPHPQQKMVIAEDCQAYTQIFMQQPGEKQPCQTNSSKGYQLFWDGVQVGSEPSWTLQQAIDNLEFNKRSYPNKKVEGLFNGQKVGYELYWDDVRVGFEPSWTREQAIANLQSNRQAYPNKKVAGLFYGEPLL